MKTKHTRLIDFRLPPFLPQFFRLPTLGYFAFFVISVFLAIAAGASEKKKITVLIDPGHGGDDSGAKFNKAREKEICLNVGLELRKLLEADKNFIPLMTRDRDLFIPLDDRSRIAEKNKAMVFVSIHANSSPDVKATGTEFYFENQVATDEESQFLANRENSAHKDGAKPIIEESKNADVNFILTDLVHNEHIKESQQLAQAMLDSFKKNLKVKTRAIRQAPFRVLGVTMPATLIELGFLSNAHEASWLMQPRSQQQAALAIYDGLKSFKVKLDRLSH